MANKEIEELLTKYHSEYLEDKENLSYATKGIEKIGRGVFPEEESTSRGPTSQERDNSNGRTTLSTERNGTSGKTTIARKVGERFVKDGYIDIRGLSINSKEDIAELAQIYRNPFFETMRVIYMRDNKIVAAEGVTSKLPSLTVIHAYQSTAIGGYMYNQKMQHLKADGYYLVHNHPSNNVKPSFDDITTTHRFRTGIEGFLGHLIVDHDSYSFFDKDGAVAQYELSEDFKNKYHDSPLSNNIEHPLLGTALDNLGKLALVGKTLNSGKDITDIVFCNSYLQVREIQEFSNACILHDKNFNNFLMNEMVRTGCDSTFILTSDDEIYNMSKTLITQGYIKDAILEQDDNIKSARAEGFRRDPKYAFAGILEEEIPKFRVRENSEIPLEVKKAIETYQENLEIEK